MIDISEMQKLAQLARISISDEEKETLRNDLEVILKYVSEIKSVSSLEMKPSVGILYNVMREDSDPHMSGVYSKELLEEAPRTERGYIKVKKIL